MMMIHVCSVVKCAYFNTCVGRNLEPSAALYSVVVVVRSKS